MQLKKIEFLKEIREIYEDFRYEMGCQKEAEAVSAKTRELSQRLCSIVLREINRQQAADLDLNEARRVRDWMNSKEKRIDSYERFMIFLKYRAYEPELNRQVEDLFCRKSKAAMLLGIIAGSASQELIDEISEKNDRKAAVKRHQLFELPQDGLVAQGKRIAAMTRAQRMTPQAKS